MANGNPIDSVLTDNPIDQALSAPAAPQAAPSAAPATPPAQPSALASAAGVGSAYLKSMDPRNLIPEKWKTEIGRGLDKMGGARLAAYEKAHPTFAGSVALGAGMPGEAAGIGELLPKAPEYAPGIYESTKSTLRSVLDRLSGTGKAIAKEEAASQAVREQNVSKWREIEQNSQQAQQAATEKNISTYREAEQHLAEKHAEVEAENKATKELWQEAVKTSEGEQQKQNVIAARRKNLEQMSEQIKPAIQTHLKNVSDAVFDNLNQRWEAVRGKIGDAVEANPETIAKGVNSAMEQVSATNRDLFDKIVKSSFGDANATALKWPDIQAAYTNLGARLAKGGLEGDVYRGLESLQDVVGNEMRSMAQARGARDDYDLVRRDWSQAMADLRDVRKSPIAKAITQADPAGAAKAFEGPQTGPAGRAQRIWARYQKFGANSYLPSKYRAMTEELDALPKPKTIRMPKEPAYKDVPEDLRVGKYTPGPGSPTSAPYQAHPVDADAIRAEKMKELKIKAGAGAAGGLVGGGVVGELIRRWFGGSTAGAPPR